MILSPTPLQRPAPVRALFRPQQPGSVPMPARPVLQTMRVPQQLCLDLQPRQQR
jgi:hypothetical protein